MHQIWSLTRTVVNMNKAFTQHFHARDRIKVTAEEAQKLKPKTDAVFDLEDSRQNAQCYYTVRTTYTTIMTQQKGTMSWKISWVHLFDRDEARWFNVKYKGYEKPEYHLFRRDCALLFEYSNSVVNQYPIIYNSTEPIF